jgi:cation diffusion facilitator CzcD-associated flavoprotein CzcO
MRKHFAIIGAGAAGLCAAKNLLAIGIEVTIFEVGSDVGGLWVYNNDSGLSPAYRSLHINSEAKVSSFVDFPFSDGISLYPDHREMHRYFQAYAEHFGLLSRIRFRSRVVAIDAEGEQYRVRLEGGAAETFDGAVIATGHQSKPRHPPQVAKFEGDYLHAHSYRVPEPFAGKRVLVIGPGNSGVDIAADICTTTQHTVLSARSPVLIMPRMMFGVPNSRVLVRLEKPFLPWRARIWIRTLLTRMFHGSMEQWGFRTPKVRTHPISHPTLISHIAWKRIEVRPGIADVKGREIRFDDGVTRTFDSIIAATGYTTEFPFLSQAASPVSETRLGLYNRIVHPKLRGLYFIGFFDVSGGSNIRMMDDQAEYIASIASGALRLPSEGDMLKAMARDHAWAEKQFPDSPRYGLELDPRRYRKALAQDYARSKLTRRPPRPDGISQIIPAFAGEVHSANGARR